MKILTIKGIGIIAGVIGVLLFSTKSVVAKLMYGYDVSAVSSVTLRMLFALPFYAIILWNDRELLRSIGKADYIKIIVMGILGYYLATICDFTGLVYIDAGLERLILFTYPTFVILFGYFLFKRPIYKMQVVAILVTYFGVGIIFYPLISGIEISGAFYVFKGAGLIVISAISYALFLSWSQEIMTRVPARMFTTLSMLISTLCIVIQYTLENEPSLWEYKTPVYAYGLIIAVFSTVVPSYVISFSVKKIGASRLGIIGALGPVSTISLAYLFLGEQLTLIQIIGAFVVIIGVFMVKK